MTAHDNRRSRLFDGSADQAKAYSQYRPRYPAELFQRIYQYAEGPQAGDTALDVATGSGQAAKELAQRYDHVIAQDPSEAQLAAAEALGDKVQFMRASAENTQLPDGSVALITVAQALHWFDFDRFYTEAHRVLRPGGTLAAWGYDMCRIEGEPEATAALHGLYSGVLGPYWDERRPLVDDHYQGLQFSADLFQDFQRWSMDMRTTTTVRGILGMIRSWSAYNTYRQQHPQKPDPLMQLHGELKDILEFGSHDYELDVTYPVFMMLGRKSTQ